MTGDLQPTNVLCSIKGLWINGIHYEQGSRVEYWHLQRSRRDDEHGRLGTINLVYTILHNDDRQVSFAEISPILVLDKIRSLYVVEGLDRSEARMDGFSRAPSGPTLLIPLTSIDYKIKLVPHFHDDTKLIALRMQYARA